MMSASAIDAAAQRLARGRLEGARLGALPGHRGIETLRIDS